MLCVILAIQQNAFDLRARSGNQVLRTSWSIDSESTDDDHLQHPVAKVEWVRMMLGISIHWSPFATYSCQTYYAFMLETNPTKAQTNARDHREKFARKGDYSPKLFNTSVPTFLWINTSLNYDSKDDTYLFIYLFKKKKLAKMALLILDSRIFFCLKGW